MNTLSSFPQVFPLLSNYSEVINWSCFLHPPMSHGSSNWRVLPTNLYWFDYISSSAYPNSDLEVGPNNLVNIKRVFEYWGQQLSSVHLVNDHTQTSLMLQYLPKTNTMTKLVLIGMMKLIEILYIWWWNTLWLSDKIHHDGQVEFDRRKMGKLQYFRRWGIEMASSPRRAPYE